MKKQNGFCPNCDSEGPVGEPCGEKGCQKRGYSFISTLYHDRLKAVAPESSDLLVGLTIEDYLIVDILGSGGFGKVYLALQKPILMKTALKLMERGGANPSLAESLARKFEGEAEALATLSHPNVVRLLKYGLHGHMPYLVMEYIDGRTLKAEINRVVVQKEAFDPDVVPHILYQILSALEAAHQRGIVHRDIKPDNIMLEEVPGDPFFVKVLDFGLAKFVEERTDTSLLMGTPIYMAPEQIEKTNIGPWTDLYAVGIILFQFITGRRPFVGRTNREVLERKLDDSYDPNSRIVDLALPDLVQDFFRSSMARDPASRIQSASDFRMAMKPVFKALEGTSGQSIAATDLSDLLDPSEIDRVRIEMKQLNREKAELAEERERLAEEKKQLSEESAPTSKPAASEAPALSPTVRRRPQILVDSPKLPIEVASSLVAESSSSDTGTSRSRRFPVGPILFAVLLLGGFTAWFFGSETPVQTVRNVASPTVVVEGDPAADALEKRSALDVRPVHGTSMVHVPGGRFAMGRKSGKGSHQVELAGFFIDRNEVSVESYGTCVDGGVCSEPWTGRYCNWSRPDRSSHPVNCLNWIQARQYCEWAGKRLPTEAEWEKAARGNDGRIYPWGNQEPDEDGIHRANLSGGADGFKGSAPCGSFPASVPDGTNDMAGNVAEWVSDWWSESPGSRHVRNPTGPSSGQHKVLRGGGWNSSAVDARSASRLKEDPTHRIATIGFRCVRPD